MFADKFIKFPSEEGTVVTFWLSPHLIEEEV